ncbi:hypothetical protein OGAPHI_004297 [Ogataea philodendri]|uniref:Uncharacterized protein n=1 Tax=Ogataea philodendri TaxID=1378263 RepID=A0A9P8T4M6_9ASCO|nr:uncharacterized protein OGAPHI_004297 [Ogataea philodendri]KAH3666108.1 hypothetical protein OGAPHI_004297 [Ogataea philodendri]
MRTSVPVFWYGLSIKACPIFPPNVGDGDPEQTTPICLVLSSAAKILFPSRGDGPFDLIPTLLKVTDLGVSSWLRILELPLNSSDLLDLETSQFSEASTGVVCSLSSCPYKHIPASSLRESLAASPIGLTDSSSKIAKKNFLATSISGIEISNPSSPVYPPLAMWNFSDDPRRSSGMNLLCPKYKSLRSEEVNFDTASCDLGP